MKTKRNLRFEISGSKNEWRWELLGGNGRSIGVSAVWFVTKQAAINAVNRLIDEVGGALTYVNGEKLE